jgi:hypothetical protein
MKRIEARLIRLEDYLQPRWQCYEVWVGQDDDTLLGPDGEVVSSEAFDARYPEVVDIGVPLEYPGGDDASA